MEMNTQMESISFANFISAPERITVRTLFYMSTEIHCKGKCLIQGCTFSNSSGSDDYEHLTSKSAYYLMYPNSTCVFCYDFKSHSYDKYSIDPLAKQLKNRMKSLGEDAVRFYVLY